MDEHANRAISTQSLVIATGVAAEERNPVKATCRFQIKYIGLGRAVYCTLELPEYGEHLIALLMDVSRQFFQGRRL